MTKCECGQVLNYAITPFMTTEKRVCLKCGKVHYIEDKPVDWARAVKGEMLHEKTKNENRPTN